MSQQEMEDFLQEKVFGGRPRSVGEALEASSTGDPELPPQPEPLDPGPQPVELPPEDAPEVVEDEPKPPAEPFPEEPPSPEAPGQDAEEEPEEPEGQDENVVWATKKYGTDPNRWAKAARDQEQHISRIANQLREAEELAGQWYEYAQQVESQAQTVATGMPLSAGEEQWVESSVTNPLEYARQAAFQGKTQLYNGVIARVAEENPMLAAQIGTQVQMEMQSYAQMEAAEEVQQPSLANALGTSFQRLGIDIQSEGPKMAEKIAELGEYNPYVQAIMHGDDGQRDLAVQAVFDLTRATSFTARPTREQNIQRENELRRDAMVVQSGGIQPPPPPREPQPFVAAMKEEWQRRGQYGDE